MSMSLYGINGDENAVDLRVFSSDDDVYVCIIVLVLMGRQKTLKCSVVTTMSVCI